MRWKRDLGFLLLGTVVGMVLLTIGPASRALSNRRFQYPDLEIPAAVGESRDPVFRVYPVPDFDAGEPGALERFLVERGWLSDREASEKKPSGWDLRDFIKDHIDKEVWSEEKCSLDQGNGVLIANAPLSTQRKVQAFLKGIRENGHRVLYTPGG